MRFWPQPLLGLDIQAEEIRLLQLQGTLKKKRIKEAITLDLPPGAVIDGKIQEAEVVGDCLQELVQQHKLQAFKVAIALPEPCVVSLRIFVAKGLSESELETEIVSHLSHSIPSTAEGLCYDYVVVNSSDAMQDEMLLVATSYANLNIPLSVVQKAGLKVQVVDVDRYALDRANQFIKKDGIEIKEKWLVSFGLAMWGYYKW
jgi:type IV pilus assembly protein PilM